MDMSLSNAMGSAAHLLNLSGGGVAEYDPDTDGLGADMYIIASDEGIVEAGTGVDTWPWRNTGSTNIFKQGTDGNRPTLKASGVLNRACVEFNGTSDFMIGRNSGDSADVPVSEFLATGGVGCVIALFAALAITSTSATAYENDTIVGDDSGSFGLVLHKTGVPVHSFRVWAWDGSADKADTTINLNTGYVGMWRKPNTSSLFGSVDGGTETEVANGTISSLTPGVQLGDGLGEEFTGELYLVEAWKDTPIDIDEIIENVVAYGAAA